MIASPCEPVKNHTMEVEYHHTMVLGWPLQATASSWQRSSPLGKARHCVEHPPANISTDKYYDCSQNGQCPLTACCQRGLDNKTGVSHCSYRTLKSRPSLSRQARIYQLCLSFLDLKYLHSGRSQICRTNRTMKGISILVWILCARFLVSSPNVRGSTILNSVIPNPVMR